MLHYMPCIALILAELVDSDVVVRFYWQFPHHLQKKMLPADRVYSGKDACDLVKTYNFPMMKMRHPEGHKLQSANVSVNADKLAVTVRARGCLSLYSCLAVSVKCTHVTDGA